jgi:hypothetical protein
MNNIDAKHIMVALASQFFDRYAPGPVAGLPVRSDYRPNVGLHMAYSFSVHNHGYEKDGATHHADWEHSVWETIHAIVLRPHSVFIARTKRNVPLKDIDPGAFVNTSNHNSCWVEGFDDINTAVFEACEACNKFTPEKHQKAPIQMSVLAQMGSAFSNRDLFTFVKVEYKNRDPHDSYFKQLTSIKPLKYKVMLEEE